MARDGLPVSCPRARWRRPPFCGPPPRGRPRRRPHAPEAAVPATTVIAAARALSLAPGRRLRTRVAGVWLVLPLLARGHCEPRVGDASSPGAAMVPATRAW